MLGGSTGRHCPCAQHTGTAIDPTGSVAIPGLGTGAQAPESQRAAAMARKEREAQRRCLSASPCSSRGRGVPGWAAGTRTPGHGGIPGCKSLLQPRSQGPAPALGKGPQSHCSCHPIRLEMPAGSTPHPRITTTGSTVHFPRSCSLHRRKENKTGSSKGSWRMVLPML